MLCGFRSFVKAIVSRPAALSRRLSNLFHRAEQAIRDYVLKTTPRRRTTRVVGLIVFAVLTVSSLGLGPCSGCEEDLIDLGVKPEFAYGLVEFFSGFFSYISGHDRTPAQANFTGTNGAQTGTASFQGSFTALTQPTSNYFALLRQQDCSLMLLNGSSSLSGSFSGGNAIPNYERTLHQLAGLTTTPDTFTNGCKEHVVGMGTRIAVFAGITTKNVAVMATTQNNGANNAVFVLTSDIAAAAPTFKPIASVTAATGLTTGDLNGDGNLDLVVVNGYNATSAYVTVLLSKGDGTYATPVNYPIAGDYSTAAVIDDVNGDGKLDIVAVSNDQHISVLLGNGDGTFQGATSFAAPTLPGYTSNTSAPILNLITADVNGDGKKDIVANNGLVLLGNGSGGFTATSAPAFPYTAINPGGFGPGLAAGDINNDGKIDLVVDTGLVITTYLGNGSGGFTQGARYASINNSGYVTLADLDGDGNLDIFTGLADAGMYSGDDSQNAAAYVLMGHGDGTFAGAPETASGAYSGTNLGDVNGDGVPDLITNGTGVYNTAGPTFTVQLGNGKGGFAAASTFTAPATFSLSGFTFSGVNTSSAASYAVGDINGDSKADLVWVTNNLNATNPGGLLIQYPYAIYFTAISNGDGTFATPVPHAFPQIAAASGFDNTLTVTNLQLADVNKDGKADLIFTYNETAGGAGTLPYNQGIGVLLGTGGGTFSSTAILTSTYSSATAPSSALLPYVTNIADLNNDGKPDLVVLAPSFSVANGTQIPLEVYLGNGDGTFQAPKTLTLSANAYALPVLADFNKDGKLDVALLAETTGSQAELVIANGNGDGTFATPTILNLAGGDAIRSAAIAAADFNNDGYIDIALLDSEDFSGIFYGSSTGTFASIPGTNYVVPKDLIGVTATNAQAAIAVDLNKDGKPDILAGATILLNLYGSAPVVPVSTTASLSASSSSVASGASVTFTATITPPTGSTATPSGTVTFYNAGTFASLGTGTLTGGQATLTTTSLPPGSDTIIASYPGDTNFTGSLSNTAAVTVSTSTTVSTTTALTASATTITAGNSITFTATVTPASGSVTPTGTVKFYDGATQIGTGTLNGSGVATYATTSLAAGSHSITASYSGDSGNNASTSSAVTVTVNPAPIGTATALTASATSATSGTSITFTATVTPASGSTVPTGTVTFLDGATQIGTGTLNGSGVATFATSSLAVGSHSITASYGGSSSFTTSTSSALSVTITAVVTPDFTLSLSPNTATVVHGSAATTTATVGSTGGFSSAVALTCTGAPSNSLCSLSLASVTPSGSSSPTSTATLQTSVQSASLARTSLIQFAFVLPIGLLGLAFYPRRRRLGTLLLAFVATACLLAATACGGGSNAQNTPTTLYPAAGTYTLTITGTSGSSTHTATWTVTIQ